MPYTNTITKVFTVLTVLLLSITGFAQNTTRSPYSFVGIGDVQSPAVAYNTAMGGVKFGTAVAQQINNANPATLYTVTKPSFNVGFNVDILTLSTVDESQSGTAAGLQNINLAFPVTKWWTISPGLSPYSKMGYQFVESENVENLGNVDYVYQGSGGLNKIQLANSFALLNDSTHTLSFGLTASYLFGSLNKERRVETGVSSNAVNTRIIDNSRINDFLFDFGLFYKRKISKKISFSIGGAYSLGDSLKTINDKLGYTYSGAVTTKVVKDTIVNTNDTGNTYLPSSFGVGGALIITNKHDKYYRELTIGFDYSQTNWGDLALLGSNLSLAKLQQFSVGMQYIPDTKTFKNVQKMMNYRLGIRYANTHLQSNNNPVTEYGISFGLGIPIITAGQGTMFNLGIETGQRGNTNTNLIKEQFTTISIGLSLSPSKFDRWFYKSKIE